MRNLITLEGSEAVFERLKARRPAPTGSQEAAAVFPLALAPSTFSVKRRGGATEFIPLARAQRKRLHETIVSELQALISAGRLKVGDQLPPERLLADDLGVSRNSVREALRILESKGVLTARQGRGVFVGSSDPSVPSGLLAIGRGEPTMSEMFDVRERLEREAARNAALLADDRDLASLERALVAFECLILGADNPLGADAEFHSALADASGNRYLAFTIKRVIYEMGGGRAALTEGSHLALVVLNHHVNVYDAIRRRDPEAAADAMSEHLREIKSFHE